MKRLIFMVLLQVLLIINLNVPASAQTETPVSPPPGSWKGMVDGKVINRTPGGSVPGPIDIMLHGWDKDGNQALMLHGQSNADGTYLFSDVDFQSGIQVTVMSSYQDAAYYSNSVDIEAGQTSLDLDVPIYESTSDLAAVMIDAMHLLFYFEGPDLTITEVYVLGNQGDRTVKDVVNLPRDRKATLKFPLPENAKNVTFDTQETDRFVLLPDGFGDTAPLTPGSRTSQVVVRFNLPYQDTLDYLFQLPVPVGSLNILVPVDSGLSIQGDSLTSEGVQSIQGNSYDIYTRHGLNANEQLRLNLSGKPAFSISDKLSQAADQPIVKISTTGLIYGGGALGVAFVIVGIFMWRKSALTKDEEEFSGDEETVGEQDQPIE